MDKEKLTGFLTELAKLTDKYGLIIGGCGCCGSPWVYNRSECVNNLDYDLNKKAYCVQVDNSISDSYDLFYGQINGDNEINKRFDVLDNIESSDVKFMTEIISQKKAKEKNNLSIDKYVPFDYNTHTVRITFNWCGAVGHISYILKGNCKGADILESALDFISDCDMNDIENLVENDCHLAMSSNDDPIFSLHLHKDNNNDVMLSELDAKEVEELIVAVEIVDCKGEIEIEDV